MSLVAFSNGEAPFSIVPAGDFNISSATLLISGDTVCPDNYPSGFALVCSIPNARFVQCFVNGQPEKRESVMPFTIAGGKDGKINPWKHCRGSFVVDCRSESGMSTTV